jgi:integrase/recombinase XerD
MTRQRAWQIIKAYGKMAAIENLHPHKFRHGIAIYLMEKGVPMPIISNRLGHSNPITTMRFYQRITPEIQRKMLEGIKWRE